jgi:hypothetical protein
MVELGPDNALAKQFNGKTPEARAAEMIDGSKPPMLNSKTVGYGW